jgi:flagellar hook protein FlgE
MGCLGRGRLPPIENTPSFGCPRGSLLARDELMTATGIGFESGKRRGRPRFAQAFTAFAWLLPLGCGDYMSWDDRSLFDGHDEGGSSAATSNGEASPIPACDAAPIEGYGYAEAPEFWLGTQAALELRVEGPGHLVAGTGDASELRYLRAGEVSVAPDGNLELGGEPALGYPQNVTPGEACLSQLRAPSFAPPKATSSIDIGMNVDPRSSIVTFDVSDPNGTSNDSLDMTVFDSAGTLHPFHMYFSNLGEMAYEYRVVANGGDLVGGTPGEFVLVSTGSLQFDSNGVLSSSTTPPVDIPFVGADAPIHIELRFAPDIASGASSYEGSTSFASDTEVFSLTADGQTEGTGAGMDVRPNGDVLVYYDNGETLSIGTLALARFRSEAGLAPFGEGWSMTPESGPPQLGVPQSSGRGMIVGGAVSVWP